MSNKKIKFSEAVSHAFKRHKLYNGFQFLLIVGILVVAYYCIYLWVDNNNLPEIDITQNKIHTLSDSSKSVMSQIDKEIYIYVYGYDEDDSIFELLRQYNKTNSLINYKRITEETDLDIITNHNLSEGYTAVIISCGEYEKIIDASEFQKLDYTTYQYVDITEQVLTNSILSLVEDNKPKIYFLAGHQEYTDNELTTIKYFLTNESFEYETLNLSTEESIPEDCYILAIIAPQSDIKEGEAELIRSYIQKGGNIFVSVGVLSEENKNLPNLKSVLDLYGVEIENGFIFEYAENMSPANYPFVFIPEVSSTNKITADIYTDSSLTLVESARIKIKNDSELEALNVTADVIINSSEESVFINDLSADSIANASMSADTGSSDIAGTFEKTVLLEDGEEATSKLVIIASSTFMADVYSQYVSANYPLSYIGSNKDFVINSMAYLGDKDYTLTIRKDYAINTYTSTENQNRIVLTIIFSVPLFIIFVGIIIWRYRKKRK